MNIAVVMSINITYRSNIMEIIVSIMLLMLSLNVYAFDPVDDSLLSNQVTGNAIVSTTNNSMSITNSRHITYMNVPSTHVDLISVGRHEYVSKDLLRNHASLLISKSQEILSSIRRSR